MPVDSTHPDYDEYAPLWKRCSDAVEGQTCVHKAGVAYLPKLKDQSEEDYAAYKMRANYFNAAGRTLDGLVGMIFRKPPQTVLPAALKTLSEDIDLAGTDLDGLVQEITECVLEKGRVGILVEYPQVIQPPGSQADAIRQNLRPYATVYEAESVINWRVERVDNVMMATMVALMEEYVVSDDGFERKCDKQVRVLLLQEGRYIQQVWRKVKDKWEQFEDDIIPLMRGKPLSYIPFLIFGKDENDFEVDEPPLLDLVDLNLAHYRINADYQHGCHFAGLPTAVVAGYTADENEKLYIGSATAWVFPDPNAHAEFLEFTGQGLGALEKNLDRIEAQMAAVGARMLAPEKTGVEASATLQMRHSGEYSVLAAYANTISRGIVDMLQIMAEWEGANGEISYALNTDYLPVSMSAQDLAEIVKSWQSGAISFDTLFANLKRGEIIPDERTLDEERELIADDGAPLGADSQ